MAEEGQKKVIPIWAKGLIIGAVAGGVWLVNTIAFTVLVRLVAPPLLLRGSVRSVVLTIEIAASCVGCVVAAWAVLAGIRFFRMARSGALFSLLIAHLLPFVGRLVLGNSPAAAIAKAHGPLLLFGVLDFVLRVALPFVAGWIAASVLTRHGAKTGKELEASSQGATPDEGER